MFQGNTRERTWVDQQMKTVHITKENHRSLEAITKVSEIINYGWNQLTNNCIF